jgi:hypothetical protein
MVVRSGQVEEDGLKGRKLIDCGSCLVGSGLKESSCSDRSRVEGRRIKLSCGLSPHLVLELCSKDRLIF